MLWLAAARRVRARSPRPGGRASRLTPPPLCRSHAASALLLACDVGACRAVAALLSCCAFSDAALASALSSALGRGRFGVARDLLAAGASPSLDAGAGARTPLDSLALRLLSCRGAPLASHPASPLAPKPHLTVEVFAFGSSSNFTLGTDSQAGGAGRDAPPRPVSALFAASAPVTALSAGKLHSAAVCSDGRLFTWGWGHGGRTGHAEAHAGATPAPADSAPAAAAVLLPRAVACGAVPAKWAAVACGKHHTLAVATDGSLWAWGANRFGKLGLGAGAPDTAPSPRRVGACARLLRPSASASSTLLFSSVAAANKHSVGVTRCGAVLTWGCNESGQLGHTLPGGAVRGPRSRCTRLRLVRPSRH